MAGFQHHVTLCITVHLVGRDRRNTHYGRANAINGTWMTFAIRVFLVAIATAALVVAVVHDDKEALMLSIVCLLLAIFARVLRKTR